AAYAALPDGELFHVLHPSKRSPESALMYNAKYPKREAKPAAAEEKRGLVSEYEYFADPDTARVFSEAGIRTITYAEAVPCPINSFLKIKREQDAKKDGNP
ncbi:MAG: hypothetical protein LBM78_02930, partial [Clostridiales bacterium]|nr:hypothetical protein [Clostridiales bacterium]